MAVWSSANMANIIIIVLLALVIGLGIRRIIRNKKAGRTSCGCGCSSCSACAGRKEKLENRKEIR